ncbi:GNAT family N-acetyltransferase [Croceibacter atlanticus]|uniref:GNAT family N-acetyltransferase n=1 Tax=Croceibacter atlanticus TaxID=313588 RepID=UPI0024B9BDA3|nr:GNAT family N-acetyltransferase [Croceibacter atlanticus]
MNLNEVQINKSDLLDIKSHLINCDAIFEPPLSSYVDIEKYAKKLYENAVRFEIWEAKRLTCLLAVYINKEDKNVFISNISIEKNSQGKGFGKLLLNSLIKSSLTKQCNEILLEVFNNNTKAIHFYYNFGFSKLDECNDKLVLSFKING